MIIFCYIFKYLVLFIIQLILFDSFDIVVLREELIVEGSTFDSTVELKLIEVNPK